MRTSWTDKHFDEAFERLSHAEELASAIYNKYNESTLVCTLNFSCTL